MFGINFDFIPNLVTRYKFQDINLEDFYIFNSLNESIGKRHVETKKNYSFSVALLNRFEWNENQAQLCSVQPRLYCSKRKLFIISSMSFLSIFFAKIFLNVNFLHFLYFQYKWNTKLAKKNLCYLFIQFSLISSKKARKSEQKRKLQIFV